MSMYEKIIPITLSAKYTFMISFAHIAILVKDLNKMEIFYQTLFGLRTEWKKMGEKAYLTTGNNDIFALLVGDYSGNKFDLSHVETNPNETPNFFHFGVVVNSDPEFESLFEKAKNMGIKIYGPKVSRDVTKSFYVYDPEHNPVQVVFPPAEYFHPKDPIIL